MGSKGKVKVKGLGMLPKVVIFLTILLALHFFVLFHYASDRLDTTAQQVIQRVKKWARAI